ncbi:MAG: NAD(P)H-dependent glycerol-3-phosphate dehydrogenase [Elusimicrobiaceae bacterium]|nr:NAD(P)H-dependent glycerol-3-phosphate dehydrogenase [Elusimicrobiaceae bacterium]
MKINNITVFGAGVWGSVIAQYLAEGGYKISLWEYNKDLLASFKDRTHPNIENFTFNENITFFGDIKQALENTDLAFIVISTKGIRGFCANLKTALDGKVIPVISASKGIEDESYKTICEIIEEEIPHLKNQVMAFTGPTFALEVAKHIPTKIMLAGSDEKLLKNLEKALTKKPIIVEISTDRRGVEYGGAIKNVLAIGCGILDGIRTGANTKSALIVKAMQEMNQIMLKEGAKTETVYGLAGLGDVILTGMSQMSRNRKLGEKLGQGKDLQTSIEEVGTVAEGVNSVASVYHLIERHKINAPVISAIWQVVCKGEKPTVLVKAMGL